MPAYIVFVREKALGYSSEEAYWSKSSQTLNNRPIKVLSFDGRHVTLEGRKIKCVVVGWLNVASALCESPAQQEACQHQFDSWLADMQYCDRF